MEGVKGVGVRSGGDGGVGRGGRDGVADVVEASALVVEIVPVWVPGPGRCPNHPKKDVSGTPAHFFLFKYLYLSLKRLLACTSLQVPSRHNGKLQNVYQNSMQT